MSKKVFCWMIADLVFVLLVDFLVIVVRNAAVAHIANEIAHTAIYWVFNAVWIVADLFVLFWFLLYWWSDVTYTRIKNRRKRK